MHSVLMAKAEAEDELRSPAGKRRRPGEELASSNDFLHFFHSASSKTAGQDLHKVEFWFNLLIGFAVAPHCGVLPVQTLGRGTADTSICSAC